MTAITLYDRIEETTTTTGTGNITLLGAVSGCKTFSSRYAVDTAPNFYYCIEGQTPGEWEVGYGYLSGSTTLVRDTVIASSNSDALVSFSAGTKNVYVTIAAKRVNELPTLGKARANACGYAMP